MESLRRREGEKWNWKTVEGSDRVDFCVTKYACVPARERMLGGNVLVGGCVSKRVCACG